LGSLNETLDVIEQASLLRHGSASSSSRNEFRL
jgi:hypothetical protein